MTGNKVRKGWLQNQQLYNKSHMKHTYTHILYIHTLAFLSYSFRQFADPKRQGGIGYRLCIHESYQWSRHHCFKTFLWGFSCLWMKLVSVYMATSGRHSTKACIGFLVKKRGYSEKKMLILFFKPILSPLLLTSLYLLSTCYFFSCPSYLFQLRLLIWESSSAEDSDQVSNDEIPTAPYFRQWILHLPLRSMIFRFRNMLKYLLITPGLEELRVS